VHDRRDTFAASVPNRNCTGACLATRTARDISDTVAPLTRRHSVQLLAALLLATSLMSGCGGEQGGSEAGPRAGAEPRVEVVARGLEAPWDIAFLPDGRALVTERPGRVRLLTAEGTLRGAPVASVNVRAEGEGGLLGLAVDPDFGRNGFVYLYRSADTGNEIVRYRLEGERLIEQQVIVDGIPAGLVHNGGRMHFGPDDRLYVSTGDAGEARLAQDETSLAGKFLRLSEELYHGSGGRPEVYSLGHRNPQGFDWEPGTGRLRPPAARLRGCNRRAVGSWLRHACRLGLEREPADSGSAG
jgi:glucose/arabinose dehydrogenase